MNDKKRPAFEFNKFVPIKILVYKLFIPNSNTGSGHNLLRSGSFRF